jgi:hypothetical protein
MRRIAMRLTHDYALRPYRDCLDRCTLAADHRQFCAGGLVRQSGGLRTGWTCDCWAMDGEAGHRSRATNLFVVALSF